jgi:RNA polymerase sigma factor (sigma-70 family)
MGAGHERVVTINDYDSSTDAELWTRASESRDGPAFGQLFERHADAVYNHCFRRIASWSLAEDLTSAVFLHAWRRRGDVKFAGGSVLPWLLAVANNEIRNAERSRRRYRRLLARARPALPQGDIADEVAERADQEKSARLALRALEGLRAEERDVLSLCGWAGLSYQDAAEVLGVPVNTVRSRLARARQHLKERMAGDQPAPTALPFGAAVKENLR